ncbi:MULTISPECIES: YpdA family putative bacillithiol disulfide reductase [Myroides]|uniref:YpdA family putative bacillithiol disulfide reductase n=1 Tax=Myroides albus TaxID=2562892 RepID=A0A6I3LP03_9FLAO|nr:MULTISPECIES: YpdA family putative bacillithiol disulfide reductase [Myroides]MTG99050.1 YpdA family putative bacillithiol disulfide reductase [Myroides albus]MVX36648.1 YpdA family putative bacillithiol disulfide reductase [Myroides sp. LoEW2-1]UVD80407.1 YpdA family putative bacillithiol disulfide reductase [Myroides albus]
MEQFDIVIVGGGPIGIACGLEAKKQGLSYLIVEKGCIVNSLYYYPVNMQFFSSADLLELDNIPFISTEKKPRRNEALEYYRRVATSNELKINLFETVIDAKKDESDHFVITTNKANYKASNVIIATGFYDIPNLLHIKGEDLPKVTHYYNDPHFYAGMDVVVVGASNSSVDAALECYRKGANVTMVIRDGEISSHVKYWVKPDIENRIKEGSIKALFNSNLTEIKEDSVLVNTPNGDITLKNDFVLALTGYKPNFDFLKQLGIEIANTESLTPIYNPETMETNIPNLYLAGVVCGGLNTHTWFIENSREHALHIISHVISKYRFSSSNYRY